MSRVAVAPHRGFRGFDGVRTDVAEAYEVLDLREALGRTYRTDAHLVTYVVEGATRQPRVNKPGRPFFTRALTVDVLFCDVDNPEHAPWTDETFAAALAQYESLEALRTAGVYHTEHGRRIVQPLAEPIPVELLEPHLRRWFLDLERAGLVVDWSCRDWTRHYRLPHVRRGGVPYRSPWVDLGRMQPIALAPLPSPDESVPVPPRARARPRERPAAPVAEPAWTAALPPFWEERVAVLAEAVRAVTSEWHTLFLALAGALLSRQVPPEHVPALCRAVSLATGADSRTEDRAAGARTSVQRWLAGDPLTGYGRLAAEWPDVAEALDQVTASGPEAHLRALAAASAPPAHTTASEASAALEEAIRRAPPGLTLISSECGLGKTAAALRVAGERAAKPYASSDAAGARAPLQSKTSISVDKNALALQIQADLQARGVAVRRIFGPLSVVQEDGTPACRFHDTAQHLVAGGQAIRREFCEGRGLERCEHYDACAARDGTEGPDDARVTIGPHALIGPLDAAAGTTGLLVIDEPPPLLETVTLTVDDLDRTLAVLDAFDGGYTDALQPALVALRAWIARLGSVGAATTLADAVRGGADAVETRTLDRARRVAGVEGDAVSCAAAAPLPDPRNTAPPLRYIELAFAQRHVHRAKELGAASAVLGCIHHALSTEWRVVGRVEEHRGQRVLLVTRARERLSEALRREGAVVAMDANIALHAAVYQKAVGYAPPLHDFRAPDGAPIARAVVLCRSANRRHWLRSGQLTAAPSLVNAVRVLVAWAREDPAARRLGVITLKPIRLALEAVLRPEDPAVAEAWRQARQPEKVLVELRPLLGPLIEEWPGEVVLGHYGAVRGLNSMADVDCLATLGDPWPNLGEVASDVAFLELEDEGHARAEALCRAELEQAHGRLRTIHRTRPGRALHIGRVLPSGSGWSDGQVEIRQMPVGRPGAADPVGQDALDELVARCGSVRAAARQLGCSEAYLRQCRSGKRPISQDISAALQALEGSREGPAGVRSKPV